MIERPKTQWELAEGESSGCWPLAAGLIFGLLIGFVMGWVANGALV